MRRQHVLVLALFFPLSACLTETRRGLGDTTDTLDTSVQDTADTSSDSDTQGFCLDVDCDDNDECTFDYCDPQTGLCQHMGYPEPGVPSEPANPEMPVEPPQCLDSCDDNDPCTTDTCEYIPEGCGVSGTYTCVHIPSDVANCLPCEDTTCNDGDPCTIDTCTAQGCSHTLMVGCDAGCTSDGTLPIEDVIAQGPADFVKTVGTLRFHPLLQACNDGPTCDCIGYPGLAGENQQVILDVPGDQTFATWSCESTGCAATGDTLKTTCDPVQLGVRYRVWGRPMAEWEVGQGTGAQGEGGAAVPPLQIGAISVTDYCLETTERSLAGEYTGTWEHNGFLATVTATIKTPAKLAITNVRCPAHEACPHGGLTLDLPLEIGDGYVDVVTSTSPLPLGGASVRLYSQRNTLTGSYGAGVIPFSSGAAQDVAPLYGTLTLVRQAPTTTSSPR